MVVIAFSRTLVMTVHLSLGHSAICWQLESWVFPRKNPTCNKSQDTATVIGVTNGSFFRAKHKAVTLLFTNTWKRADQMLGVLNHLSELWCFGDVRLHNSIYQRDIELHAAIFCLSSGSEVELDRLSRALGPVQSVSHNPHWKAPPEGFCGRLAHRPKITSYPIDQI